jgi:hypothetical protein
MSPQIQIWHQSIELLKEKPGSQAMCMEKDVIIFRPASGDLVSPEATSSLQYDSLSASQGKINSYLAREFWNGQTKSE